MHVLPWQLSAEAMQADELGLQQTPDSCLRLYSLLLGLYSLISMDQASVWKHAPGTCAWPMDSVSRSHGPHLSKVWLAGDVLDEHTLGQT